MTYYKSFQLKKVKSFVLFSCALFLATLSFSQDYYHGIGAQADIGIFNLAFTSTDLDYDETLNPAVPGLFYKATLAFTDQFAVSAYPFVGFSGSFNSRTGASGSLGIQLPVVAEFYMGDIDDSCFFVGAGMAFGSLGSSEFGSGSVFGPQISLGGQFELSRRLIGLRAAYTHGINKSDPIDGIEFTKDTHTLISLGIYYLLGQ